MRSRSATKSAISRLKWPAVLATVMAVSAVLSQPASAATPDVLAMTGYTPSQGPVGTVVKITGTGFVAADIVQFNGTTAAVSSVNKKGTKLTTAVPPLATSGPLTVTDPVTGQTVGIPGEIFQITTGIHADPAHAWPGQHITIAGSALAPDVLEQLSLGGEMIEDVRTNAQGDFQVGFDVPWTERTGRVPIVLIDPAYGQILSILEILEQWPQYGHDPQRTSDNPVDTGIKGSNVGGLKVRWTSDLGGISRTSPIVAGGDVYVGNDDDLVAEDAVTGAVKWTFTTDDLIVGSPAVDNGIVFVSSYDGFLYALGASDGHFVWRFPTGGTGASPLVSKGVVYMPDAEGFLWALGETDGHLIWDSSPGSGNLQSPAIANGVVYAGDDDGNLYAFKAKTGAQLWSLNVGGVANSVSVEGGTILVPSADGFLYAVSASTHGFLWHASEGTSDYGSVASTSTAVFISNDYFVRAVDLATGTILWTYETGFIGPQSPAYANGIVYFSDDAGLFALSASTGAFLWGHTPKTGYFDTSSPVISGGLLYEGYEGSSPSVGGGVYVYGP